MEIEYVFEIGRESEEARASGRVTLSATVTATGSVSVTETGTVSENAKSSGLAAWRGCSASASMGLEKQPDGGSDACREIGSDATAVESLKGIAGEIGAKVKASEGADAVETQKESGRILGVAQVSVDGHRAREAA